ncbi:tripartite tricarboxylate transporter permease [Shumkonia mesophila]|uniref:tripartite tricarboxylate transporter permease n=1 Tax=Shumkonia mesophila TaxID=2838854 RepID=UPI002934B897|nr:tripartite tricarboxylate transporter permease [Shumkonia mesophila]
MDAIIQGLLSGLAPTNLMFAFLGCASGILFGALPGISSAMGVVLLLPFTYQMDGIPAIILLVSNFCGSTFGGSVTSILFATPGTPESVMTVLDGHPMHKQGKGGKALGLATSASIMGGLFSATMMVILVVPLSKVALEFGPAEYVALGILGMTAIAGLGSGSQLKTLISGVLGLVLATFGTDEITGITRFNFGSAEFVNGIHFIPVMIGAFALSEVFMQAMEKIQRHDLSMTKKVKVEFMTWVEFLRYKWVILKSAVIGMVVGVLPGTGGTIASVLAYSEAVRSSEQSEKFGTGMPEGVVAPETANNASTGGALVPTLTLGIPGSGTTAVILGAFIVHGMRPGPLLFISQPTLLYAVFISMIIANIMLFWGGIYGVRIFAQVSRFPYFLQGPTILLLCFIGSFALGTDMMNAWIMLLAGVVGFFMKKYGFNIAGLVLGLVLGELIEANIRKMMIIAGGDWLELFLRPIAGPIFLLAFGAMMVPHVKKWISIRKIQTAE